GVIPIIGPIEDSSPVLSQIVEFRQDKRIRAIILRIDSPGGGVGASQEIYREIRKTIQTKKVITSMGGMAASGGYYIASAGTKIVANPGTVTGSIGVIMQFYQVQELAKKIGIQMEVIKSGEFKDVGSPFREVNEKDRELINDFILEIQEQFISAVARGRNLPVEKVKEIADGRILTGAKAKDLGLVDTLGNFEDAVDLAKEVAGIKGDVDLVYPKRSSEFNLLEFFLQGTAKVVYKNIMDAFETRIEYRWNVM
ncbi:signal peptide peptidase SppA, partial [Thermodesulfobacteriota bacterium]